MVVFTNVTKKYGNHTVVKDLNLHINENEFVVLIGPSGCGKTTSLKMINRLIEPTSGTIHVRGQDVRKLNPVTLRREIGYVIQQIGLFPNMTIAQNVDLVPRLLGWDEKRRKERVEELLTMVGMDPAIYTSRYPTELSGGQQQRIGVLRALAAEPPLILMDEPFGALDPITRETLQDELKNLQNELNKTIIFVTHDMDEALKLADRIVIMKDGEPVQAAPPEELLRKPANDFVVSFLGKKRLNGNGLEQVDQIMMEKPVTVLPSLGLAEALALMKRKHVDTVLVTEKAGKFIGIVTADEVNRLRKAKTLGEIVESDTPVIERSASAKETFDKMTEEKLPYLPVIDESQKLIGLVTRSSMVSAMASAVWGDEDE